MSAPFAPLKARNLYKLRLLDAAVLLYNVWRAAGKDYIGCEDASRTLEDITNAFWKRVYVEESLLESCLWSCNMLKERGEWEDVKGRTFEEFTASLVAPARFNPTYNVIEKKGDA